MELPPTILIIIGITGDLARRKLIPAVLEIKKAGFLPSNFRLIGITRSAHRVEEVLTTPQYAELSSMTELFIMDLMDAEDYVRLDKHLHTLELSFHSTIAAQRIFYLSLPPHATRPVIRLLGESGLNSRSNTKLLLEKPFGVDLASATEMVESLKKYFLESQVYRIDHYLAKEMAQNLLIFRKSNSLFRGTWNRDFIQDIHIIASETIGIEGRALFYEQTGALRDVLQSHLMQLAALTLMDIPGVEDWGVIPEYRARALSQLRFPPYVAFDGYVTRGQYDGYRSEVTNPGSSIETFVSLTLESLDPTWSGVPIRLTTGKSLSRKTTEIRIRYKKENSFEANELVLKVQPEEGIHLEMWAKKPGYDDELKKHVLDFSFGEHYDSLPEAYERVLVDAFRSSQNFFLSSEETIIAWQLLDPVIGHWGMHTEDLLMYPQGSTVEEIIDIA